MVVMIVGNRGAVLNNTEKLDQRLRRVGQVYTMKPLESCQDITVLDFRVALKASSDKLAFDWLVKGRGYSKFSVIPTRKGSLGLAKFGKAECRKAFFTCLPKPDGVKPERRLDVYGTGIIRRGK